MRHTTETSIPSSEAGGTSPGFGPALALASLATAFIAAPLLGLAHDLFISHVFVEDAFYYLVPAMQYHSTGVIALDGRTWTNGYHPLWMLINLAITALIQEKQRLPYIVSGVGWASAVVAFGLLSRASDWQSEADATKKTVFPYALASVWLLSPMYYLWLNGMESAVALLSLVACVAVSCMKPGLSSAMLLGLALGLAVLARLDFILLAAMMLLALAVWHAMHEGGSIATRYTATACGICVLVVAPYFLLNKIAFGGFGTSSAMSKVFYARHTGETGIEHLVANLAAFTGNFFSQLVGQPSPTLSRGFLGLLVIGLAGWGLRVKAHKTLRDGALRDWLEVVICIFPIVHAVAYAYALGHFARDAYINWYFVPQVFALGYLAAVGAADIVASRSQALLPLALLVLLPLFGCGLERISKIRGFTHVSPFVALGHSINLTTPPGSRIAAFSAGTQAFLAEEGRTVSNIDGLISSREFVTKHLIPGHIFEYLCKEDIDFFSDHAGDLQVSPLSWPSGNGVSIAIPESQMELVAQGPSWSNGFLNVVQVHKADFIRKEPELISHRVGSALGKMFATTKSTGQQEPIAPATAATEEALELPSLVGKEVSNVFGFVTLDAGAYKVVVDGQLNCGPEEEEGGLVRVSLASWIDAITWAETVFDRQRLGPDGRVRLVLFGHVGTRSETAEVRVATLGTGAALRVFSVDIYRIKDVVDE